MIFFIQQLDTGLKIQNNLPLLQRFNKQFILEVLSIIFEFNHFCINRAFIHQIKGTVMGKLYPQDFCWFFTSTNFQFLHEYFHKSLEHFNIENFYSMINNLDPDWRFIFENLPKNLTLLCINGQVVESNVVFDTHFEPTNSFNYLTYTSFHSPQKKKTIYRCH